MAVLLTLARHTRAREAQMELRADEILRIADEASNDWMEAETKDGADTPGYRSRAEQDAAMVDDAVRVFWRSAVAGRWEGDTGGDSGAERAAAS